MKAVISLQLQPGAQQKYGVTREDAPGPLKLSIVADGIHHFKMAGLLENSCETFETIVHIPAVSSHLLHYIRILMVFT